MIFVVTFIVMATTSFWFTDAKPLLPLPPEASALDYKNPFVKIMNALANMEEHAYKENKEAVINQFAGPGVDEEKINERTGIAENPHMYGDLLLTSEQEKWLSGGSEAVAQGFLYAATTWPNGIVPYRLDTNLNSMAKRAISNGISELQAKSCIRFVQISLQNLQLYPNYLYFTPKQGCYSMLGMIGKHQVVSIGSGCERKGIVQHEILHALGRVHEQSRPDRDKYVIINQNNIKQDLRRNFDIQYANTNGLPYDYGSVMHYGAYDFSRNGQPTITPFRPVNIGQRKGLSATDWRHLQKTYCQYEKDIADKNE